MDKWKLGEDDDEFFKKDDGSNKSFSLGKTDKEDLSDFIFEESKPDSTKKKAAQKKESKTNSAENYSKYERNSAKGGFKKIFYIIVFIAALISAYYLFKIIFPGNNTNIKLYDLKTLVYKSEVLPENNLLITGFLINKNKFPVSYVKLTCKLYSTKNIILLTKHVYAGNFINLNKLKKMSNVSINMALQNKDGVDMSDVEILPNHPVKFMAVFFDINPNSKNYSVTISHFYRIAK
ncbi:MAG: hypothetical protein M1502_00590 [Deltaproteobacteria bacterium]|jgi:hypothetical protein|nr:hypothetical protein [Deltaproteobacteria bacterium]